MLALYCRTSNHRTEAMLGKIMVVAIFIAILASLGSALVFLIRDRGGSTRTAKALTARIGISIGLFALLFVLWWLGLITPHGI
jgi:hypothetical protein